MKKFFLLIILVFICACTPQYIHLSDTKAQTPFTEPPQGKYSFSSASSIKENSMVQVGAWEVENINGKKIYRFDFKITNKGNETYETPDGIVVLDANENLLRLLNPEEMVYYFQGQTSEEALMKSISLSSMAKSFEPAQAYTGTFNYYKQSYGNTYMRTHTGYGSFSTYQDPYSAFSKGFSNGLSMGAASVAMQGAIIKHQEREAFLFALKPLLTPYGSSNIGNIWSLTGQMPIKLIVLTCGDVHKIELDVNPNNPKHIRPSKSRISNK